MSAPSFDLGPDLLFVPGDGPDRHAKAAERASAVIIDLEDAVVPADRPAAREALLASDLDPDRTIVRINPVGDPDHEADLQALRRTAYRHIMLAKTEDPRRLRLLDAQGEPYAVVGLVETAVGLAAVEQIAAAESVEAVLWGAEDLTASTGGTSSRRDDGGYRDLARYARARTLVAAAAAGIAAIDTVHFDLGDLDGLRREAEDAVACGFAASAVLHPSQAEVVRQAYRPTPEQAEWAAGVLQEATRQPGAFRFMGEMVDEVVLKRARLLSSRAQR